MARLTRTLSSRLIPVSLLCLAATLAVAADFWAKKPYQNWSAEETRNMQEESPWATSLKLGGVQTSVTSGDAPSNRSNRVEMEADPTITYVLQFRSALPIRQAQVRSSQLSSHYDKMSAEQKAAFDANAAKFLAVTFPDRVVVSVTFSSNVQEDEASLRNYWASQSLPKLSMSVYLNTKAERLSLMSYSFKDDTFQFTFPRPKEVHPDEKISVEFVHPRINVISQQRILQEFSLKKMLVNGEPSF
jgi:hypothetical protein